MLSSLIWNRIIIKAKCTKCTFLNKLSIIHHLPHTLVFSLRLLFFGLSSVSIPPLLASISHCIHLSIYIFIHIPSFHPQAQFISRFFFCSPPNSSPSPFDFYVKGTREAEICFSAFLLPDYVLQTPDEGAAKTSETQVLHRIW